MATNQAFSLELREAVRKLYVEMGAGPKAIAEKLQAQGTPVKAGLIEKWASRYGWAEQRGKSLMQPFKPAPVSKEDIHEMGRRTKANAAKALLAQSEVLAKHPGKTAKELSGPKGTVQTMRSLVGACDGIWGWSNEAAALKPVANITILSTVNVHSLPNAGTKPEKIADAREVPAENQAVDVPVTIKPVEPQPSEPAPPAELDALSGTE